MTACGGRGGVLDGGCQVGGFGDVVSVVMCKWGLKREQTMFVLDAHARTPEEHEISYRASSKLPT